MMSSENFLLAKDDGLFARKSHPNARLKFNALATYLNIMNNAMKSKWRHRWYIDLFSGPGKDKIEEKAGDSYELGSPLIALTNGAPNTRLFLNELKPKLHNILQQRVSASPLRDRVTLYNGDANQIVDLICNEIRAQEKKDSSLLSVAFLDPEGFELDWTTVEKLGQMRRMDLIITFPVGSLSRVIKRGYLDAVTRFMGTDEWKKEYDPNKPSSRWQLVELYRNRLSQFGYKLQRIFEPEHARSEIMVKTSTDVLIYSLIFASKHDLGIKFWKATTKSVEPPKLPGFD